MVGSVQHDSFSVFEDAETQQTVARLTRSVARASQETASEHIEPGVDKENDENSAKELLPAFKSDADQLLRQQPSRKEPRRKARKPFADVTALYLQQFIEGEDDMVCCLSKLSLKDAAVPSHSSSHTLPPAKSSRSTTQSSPTSSVRTYRFSMADAVRSIR